VHLFAYLATVLILFFVNLTITPKVWWFYWVALGWGAGILAHGWCAFGRRRPRAMPPATEQPTEREVRPVKQEASARTPKAKSTPRRKGPKKSS
jgi:hypothetical protein